MKPILVVMAAGMGSRYGGIKQIEPVGLHNEALLDYSTYDALESGFDKVVFIIRKDIEGDFRERIFNRIADHCNATYVFQELDSLLTAQQVAASSKRKKPWGTVHAILCATEELDAPFLVINSDDYYGREGYQIMSDHLGNIEPHSTEHAMVGYRLYNTMSPSGPVTRAICTVRDGYLVSIRENPKIHYDEQKRIVTTIDQEERQLSGDEWVSMNFFGFSLAILPFFQEYFDRFLAKEITSEKAECFLPEAVREMIDLQKGRMRFYTTKEQWFGMTYKEDLRRVREEIAHRIEKGLYPPQLWE